MTINCRYESDADVIAASEILERGTLDSSVESRALGPLDEAEPPARLRK